MAYYSDEELIQLVILNPGFGIDRLLKKIYSNKNKRLAEKRFYLVELLNNYKEEYGEDLFEMIQTTDYSKMVTEKKYKEITGEKYVPKGSGRSTSRGSKLSKGYGLGHNLKFDHLPNIQLHPQNFDWGEVVPLDKKTSTEYDYENAKSRLRLYSNIKLRDFRKMWDAYQLVLPVKSPTLVSKYLYFDTPNAVIKWIPKMLEYHEKDILEDWFEVTETLRIIEGNNALNDKELKVMFRGTFEDYVKDPINTEKPSKEDIFWVFNQLIEEFNSF